MVECLFTNQVVVGSSTAVPDLFGLTQSDINVNQKNKIAKFIRRLRRLSCLVLVNWKTSI